MENKVSAFVGLFSDIPDERQEWKVKHKLVDIIFIAVVATIANCDDWEDIEWFAKLKEPWFRRHLELPNGIPPHDTIERVFAWIDPDMFRKASLSWAALAMGIKPPGVIAIDGKTMRGTAEAGRKALHVVNAWFSEYGMVLGQVFVDEKGNGIKAVPELLDILDVAGHIVTIDAGGTYKDIAGKVVSGGGDYVLALKRNQETMFEDVRFFFENEIGKKGDGFDIQKATRLEKGHGRIEKRTYCQTDMIGWLDMKDDWPGLKSIGAVHSHTTNTSTGAVTEETRYFISSLDADVSRFAYAVRKHWGVESLHWSLDMTWNEDGRRSRKDNSAKNLSQPLRLAYDIIKSAGVPKRVAIKRLRKQAMVDDKYLDRLVSSVFS